MKRNLMYAALFVAALMVSCNGKNTAQNEANTDSTSVADTTNYSYCNCMPLHHMDKHTYLSVFQAHKEQ